MQFVVNNAFNVFVLAFSTVNNFENELSYLFFRFYTRLMH